MSIAGYYKNVIREWYAAPKKTPSLKKQMKEIIFKFYSIRDYYKEIPEDESKNLTYEFYKIEEFLNQ